MLHLAGLLILAMVTFSAVEEETQRVLMAGVTEVIEDFQEVQFQTELPELEDVAFQSVAMIDPGTIAFGEVEAAVSKSSFEVGSESMEEIGIAEVGALFGAEGHGMARTGTGSGGAEFFGVKATGNRFVFVVDSSMSMRSASSTTLVGSFSRRSGGFGKTSSFT